MNELQRIIDGPWITPDDRLHLQKVKAELTRLRNQVIQIHTLVECTAPDCKRGVRARNAVGGMCPTCAEAELTRLGEGRELWRKAEHEGHAELTRLRGIEAAVTSEWHGGELEAYDWREHAKEMREWELVGWPDVFDATADALKVKCEG